MKGRIGWRGLKQDTVLETEIKNDKDVIIDGQYIGELKGLKLNLDFRTGALDTDIKSLKKAARQGISPELTKRVNLIISSGILKLNEDFRIYWLDNPIAKIIPGKNYLEPDIDLITDDILNLDSKNKLIEFLNNWIKNLINTELKDLVNLNKFEQKNSSVRALCYQLFENNGVLKRDSVNEFIKKLEQEDRRTLRSLGVKIGRYHIFLYRIFKPSAVTIRVLLWKNFFQNNLKLNPPKFGLNFLDLKKTIDQKFMLICGFENIGKFYVRVDILERFFLKIIENTKDGMFNIDSDMINLIGCNKEDFFKLLELMQYKRKKIEESKEEFFIYQPQYIKNKQRKIVKKSNANSPFGKLSELRFR